MHHMPAMRCRYDKAKVLQKEVSNVQYLACMNPTAGSFHVTPRMQRHFVTLAVQMPGPEIVRCGGWDSEYAWGMYLMARGCI